MCLTSTYIQGADNLYQKCFPGEQTVPDVKQGEAQATPAAQPVTVAATVTAGKKPQATPAVRRIASEHNVSRDFVL